MEDISSQKETYLNRDTLEILTNSLDISYYKMLQYEQIIDNKLLGFFDSKGVYVIPKDILQEFIMLKKYIKSSKEERYLISAPVDGFEELIFTLEIESEDGFKIATMRFIEKLNTLSGKKEILKTNVARYKDDDDIYFLTKVKKIFNIIDGNDGKEIDNEEFVKLILRKFKDFQVLDKEYSENEEIIEEYIDKIIDALNKYPGKYSEYILRHYNIFVEEYKEYYNKPGYYKRLRKKLDALINQTRKSLRDFNVDAIIDEARGQYVAKIQEVNRRAFEVKEPVVEKQQVKANVKKVLTSNKPKVRVKKIVKKAKTKKKESLKKKKDNQKANYIIIQSNIKKIEKKKDLKKEKEEDKKNLKKESLDLTIDEEVQPILKEINIEKSKSKENVYNELSL